MLTLVFLATPQPMATAAPINPARLTAAGDNALAIRSFAEAAAHEFGEPGATAASFLVDGMPDSDLRCLTKEFLLENLRLAMNSRKSFPWAKDVPDALFFDCVLPYAQLDEPRDPWRRTFREMCREIVKDCQSASAAAEQLNRRLFPKLGVKYDTGRMRPNQSPKESIQQGKASCTGLSILLANACRSVGIPARLAGTANWTQKSGNHTWVEIWDGTWHFTGAAEPSPDGLDRGWFTADAAMAVADDPSHAIWANSWHPSTHSFPLVWNPSNTSVPAVNVTDRYASGASNPPADSKQKTGVFTLHLRVIDDAGARMAVRVELLDHAGKLLASVTTNAGASDLNDMPSLEIKSGVAHQLRVVSDGWARDFPLGAKDVGIGTLDLAWVKGKPVKEGPGLRALRQWLAQPVARQASEIPPTSLSQSESARAIELLWDQLRSQQKVARSAEMCANVMHLGDKSMRLLSRDFGTPPPGGRSLWISMHGGGGAPEEVNDQQWKNQIRLYQPAEGLYIAPRAPTNTWNLWHESHIDDFFDRLIENCVMLAGVNPDKVYLMGYSAGGDGVYQLAPRLADRLAAASMMAGHPGDASPLGLYNLPFAIFCGGEDAAYNRNKIAAEWGDKLDSLTKQHPGAYPHRVTIYPDLGHWMNGKDAEVVPWMAACTRDPWPKTVVWCQSTRLHDRFYWLSLPAGSAKPGLTIRGNVMNQQITIDAPEGTKVILRLHDRLINLDQTVKVLLNGKRVYEGKVKRQASAVVKSLEQRADPSSAATALLEIQ